MQVAELARMWLSFKKDEVGAATLNTYTRIIRDLVVPAVGPMELQSVDAIELQALLMAALDSRSENEAVKMRAVLRGMFGHALDLQLIDSDPASRVRLPKGTGGPRAGIRDVPSPSQALAMSRALPQSYSAMPLLAAFAGLRWQEIAALKPNDFDLGGRVLTVVRAVGRVDGVKTPKSPAGVRKTVWASEVHDDIVSLLAGRAGSEWVFTSPKGCLLHYPNWRSRHWIPACDATGLGWTFHEYRHTFAVESLRRGRSVQSVASMMGHSNPRVTWEFYAGLFEDHLEDAKSRW